MPGVAGKNCGAAKSVGVGTTSDGGGAIRPSVGPGIAAPTERRGAATLPSGGRERTRPVAAATPATGGHALAAIGPAARAVGAGAGAARGTAAGAAGAGAAGAGAGARGAAAGAAGAAAGAAGAGAGAALPGPAAPAAVGATGWSEPTHIPARGAARGPWGAADRGVHGRGAPA